MIDMVKYASDALGIGADAHVCNGNEDTVRTIRYAISSLQQALVVRSWKMVEDIVCDLECELEAQE